MSVRGHGSLRGHGHRVCPRLMMVFGAGLSAMSFAVEPQGSLRQFALSHTSLFTEDNYAALQKDPPLSPATSSLKNYFCYLLLTTALLLRFRKTCQIRIKMNKASFRSIVSAHMPNTEDVAI